MQGVRIGDVVVDWWGGSGDEGGSKSESRPVIAETARAV